MATPVRYPSGVVNVNPDQAVANLPMPSKTRLHIVFDDFDEGIADDGTLGYRWATLTQQADGDIAGIDGDGGQIKIITGSLTNYDNSICKAVEGFTLEAGRRAWFGIRYKVSVEIAETAFFFGLQQKNATNGAAISTTSAERIGFKTDSGDSNVDVTIGSAGAAVASATAIDVLVANAWSTLEFEFDGVSSFKYFIDGAHSGTLTTSSFPTTEMQLIASVANTSLGSDATRATFFIDWIYAAKERMTVND